MVLVSSPIEQFKSHKKQILNSVKKTLNSGQYILGKNVADFEKNFANFIGVKYAIGVANGTDAIWLALLAADIGSGDEVIVPSHTYIASPAAILIDSKAYQEATHLHESLHLTQKFIGLANELEAYSLNIISDPRLLLLNFPER